MRKRRNAEEIIRIIRDVEKGPTVAEGEGTMMDGRVIQLGIRSCGGRASFLLVIVFASLLSCSEVAAEPSIIPGTSCEDVQAIVPRKPSFQYLKVVYKEEWTTPVLKKGTVTHYYDFVENRLRIDTNFSGGVQDVTIIDSKRGVGYDPSTKQGASFVKISPCNVPVWWDIPFWWKGGDLKKYQVATESILKRSCQVYKGDGAKEWWWNGIQLKAEKNLSMKASTRIAIEIEEDSLDPTVFDVPDDIHVESMGLTGGSLD